MNCSRQLHHYLTLRRAGTPMAAAAEDAGINAAEAKLTDAAEAKGELAHIDTEIPHPAHLQATAPASEQLPSAPASTGSGSGGQRNVPMGGAGAPSNGETDMPQHDAIDDLPDADDPLIELAAETLRGDLRDTLLGWFKAQPKSWPFMSEREQRDLADAADRYAREVVKQACQIIAAGERPCIVAKLVEYREKDGVEAKLKLASKGEIVAALHEACGKEVLIVTSGAEEFMEEAGGPAIDSDQPNLRGIGDEYDEAA